MAICDDVLTSDTEADVYTLEGVRQSVVADALPCRRDLAVFLLLSCPRAGRHAGCVQVTEIEHGKAIRMQNFEAVFDGSKPPITVAVRLASCLFPAVGEYTFEVSFLLTEGQSVQKGEQAFFVTASEE